MSTLLRKRSRNEGRSPLGLKSSGEKEERFSRRLQPYTLSSRIDRSKVLSCKKCILSEEPADVHV